MSLLNAAQLGISDLEMVLQSFSNSENCVGKENLKPNSVNKKSKLLGKRKRKTERELTILRKELKKNAMWTRESIKEMRRHHEPEFSMTEQQIYKWWWDQTRKRVKRADDCSLQSEDLAEGLLTFQDEFGGYSSRLRNQSKKMKAEEEEGLEINLCQLLGIDVEQIALRIAMGGDSENESSEWHRHTASSDISSPFKTQAGIS